MDRPFSRSGPLGRHRLTSRLIAAVLPLCLLSLGSVAGCGRRTPVLEDLSGVEELKARFNEDTGKPRIVLLLSPT